MMSRKERAEMFDKSAKKATNVSKSFMANKPVAYGTIGGVGLFVLGLSLLPAVAVGAVIGIGTSLVIKEDEEVK